MLCVCPDTPQQAWQGGWGCPLDKQAQDVSAQPRSPPVSWGDLLPVLRWVILECCSRGEITKEGRLGFIAGSTGSFLFLRNLRNSNPPPEGPYSSEVSLLCSLKPFRRYGIWFGVRERVLKALGINRGERKEMKRGKCIVVESLGSGFGGSASYQLGQVLEPSPSLISSFVRWNSNGP